MKAGGRIGQAPLPSAPPLPGAEPFYPPISLPSALDPPPLSAPLLAPADADAAAAAASASAAAAFGADLAVASARVRNRFVAKVFALLLAQLLLVAAVALTVPRSLAASPALLAASGAASLSLALILSCSASARRAHPLNLVLLALFSAAQGLLAASATAGLGRRVVVDAVLVAALAVAALSAYAFWRADAAAAAEAGGDGQRRPAGGRDDFAATEGMLLTGLVLLLAATVGRALLPPPVAPRPVDLLISACGALLFCAYVCWDVERLLARGGGGEGGGSGFGGGGGGAAGGAAFGPDDAVLAVLTIEVDILNLFFYVLDLLRAVEGDGER